MSVAAAEMAVEAVHLFVFDDQFFARVIFGEPFGLLPAAGADAIVRPNSVRSSPACVRANRVRPGP